MALSIVGSAIGTTTATIPTHQVGDLIILRSYRSGNNTPPTKPTAGGTVPTWVDIDAPTGANTNSMRTAYFVATATTTTTGTWTSADRTSVTVYRGQAASPIGGHAEQGAGSASVTAPSITQVVTDGTSIIEHTHCAKILPAGGWGAANTGYTNQSSATAFTNANTGMMVNTKDVTTSDGSVTQTIVSTNGYRAATIEILAYVAPPAGTPAFRSAGTVLTGSSSTTAAVPVPAGVAADDIVMVFFYVETTQAITAPAGFTEDTNSPATVTGASAHNQRVFWKRATGADSGTYAFTIAAGLAWRQAGAVAYSGCITSGNPFDFTNSAIKTTTTTGATPAVSGTTLGANRLLVFGATEFNFSVLTPPSGFTKRFEYAADNAVVAADKVQAVAGATGSLTGTFAGNNATSAWLGALIPAATGRDASGDFFAMM